VPEKAGALLAAIEVEQSNAKQPLTVVLSRTDSEFPFLAAAVKIATAVCELKRS
jgi:hypothetical protein